MTRTRGSVPDLRSLHAAGITQLTLDVAHSLLHDLVVCDADLVDVAHIDEHSAGTRS